MTLEVDAKRCIENARYLKDRLRNSIISEMLNEHSFSIVFERQLKQEFIHKWQLSCERDMTHVVVMPCVTTQMLDNFVSEFAKKRFIWYQDGNKVQPPCLANDIGTHNCVCPHHKN